MYMIDELSNSNVTSYDYVENNFDIDDYILWLALQARKKKVEKFIMDNPNEKGKIKGSFREGEYTNIRG